MIPKINRGDVTDVQMCLCNPDEPVTKKVADLLQIRVSVVMFQATSRDLSPEN